MPIFEYRCKACGEKFEALQSRGDDPTTSCPSCGETRLQRLLSVFAVTQPRGLPPGPCGSSDCACRRS